MLHSVLAVLAGYLTMVVIVIVATMLAVRFILGKPFAEMKNSAAGPLPSTYLTANLTVSGLAALAGGWITATIATTAPMNHGLALAALVLVMGLLSMRQSAGRQPRWYQIVIATAMPALALVGAWLTASSWNSGG